MRLFLILFLVTTSALPKSMWMKNKDFGDCDGKNRKAFKTKQECKDITGKKCSKIPRKYNCVYWKIENNDPVVDETLKQQYLAQQAADKLEKKNLKIEIDKALVKLEAGTDLTNKELRDVLVYLLGKR